MGMIKLICSFFILQTLPSFAYSFEVVLEQNKDRVWKAIPLEPNLAAGIELECKLMEGGSPTAGSVTWIYKKNNKTTNAKHLVTNGAVGNVKDRYSLVGNNLKIKPLRKTDSGTYSCEGKDKDEKHPSKTAYYYIVVTYAPNIPKCGPHDGNKKIAIDTTAELACQSDGLPLPTYTWFKDGKRLPAISSDNPAYDSSSFYYSPESGQLVFQVVSEHDSGSYACQAVNSRGSTTCPEFSLSAYEDFAARLASSGKARRKLAWTIGGVIAALAVIGLPIAFMAHKKGWFRSKSCPKCPADKRRKSTSIFVTSVDSNKVEESKMLKLSPASSNGASRRDRFFSWF